MSIYDDLIRFKLCLLDRVKRELPKLHPVAQKAAHVDVTYIEHQMAGYYERLDLWYQRVWALQGLWLDPEGRVLRHKGKEAVLTQREFELLLFLAQRPGQVFTRSELMDQVWRYSFYSDTSTVTVHTRRLRQKIEADPERPRYLQTVWGYGYRFMP